MWVCAQAFFVLHARWRLGNPANLLLGVSGKSTQLDGRVLSMHSSSTPAEAPPSSVNTRGGAPRFRQTVIDHVSGSQIGAALDVYWRGMRLFTVSAIALLAALIVFTILVDYAPIHRVPAYTDVAGGLVKLSAIGDARIGRILVGEGASVRKGTILAVLDTDRQDTEGGSERTMLTGKLDVERALLADEIVTARRETEVMHDLADSKIAGLLKERSSLLAELASGERLLGSLSNQSAHINRMAADGYVSRIQADEKRDQVTRQEGQVASSRVALSRVERDIDLTRIERRLADTRLANVVESKQRSSGELDRLTTKTKADAEQVIVAPEAGIVSSAMVSRGQSVLVGQTLFTLAPKGKPMVVRLIVPARAAGTVRPGLAIRLVFRAYPQEKFGDFDARIVQVSETPLLPADLPQIYQATGPAYMAVATLSQPLHGPNGETLTLKAGMLADALVPQERRSAMEWLLEPLLRGFNTSVSARAHDQDAAP